MRPEMQDNKPSQPNSSTTPKKVEKKGNEIIISVKQFEIKDPNNKLKTQKDLFQLLQSLNLPIPNIEEEDKEQVISNEDDIEIIDPEVITGNEVVEVDPELAEPIKKESNKKAHLALFFLVLFLVSSIGQPRLFGIYIAGYVAYLSYNYFNKKIKQ